jgi:membrane-bound ClpP family serine protease
MVKSTLNKFFNSSASTKLEGTATIPATSNPATSNRMVKTSNRMPSVSSGESSSSSTFGFNLIAGKAIVDAMIQPSKNGRVRFQGTWWSARCEQDVTILPGEAVQVVGRQNITLLVEPMPLAMVDNAKDLN